LNCGAKEEVLCEHCGTLLLSMKIFSYSNITVIVMLRDMMMTMMMIMMTTTTAEIVLLLVVVVVVAVVVVSHSGLTGFQRVQSLSKH
jgi:hypothetical protein